ncbi:unnamed protein product [Vitrella brassicaformis CCMP3155]|uniref:DOPA 4,5-dioxygenase n=2 Tax=Vitrella brassicaformis TaxID=1169539 RepID=A0A0G4G7X2_VITBC|nr:unnamed protein product [Vitrella brassicaformis CCMP3155]|mmetsp:Transcript_46299/g.115176  ORF Transcript_46299/g.115176 Transcript_46299/m.115176 type:complete len:208 (+) Transcript_46299:78-701(+)|eukprot:CEM24598.1 unnamed protein product [Vitrella brassicaformis CCMP3155]
MKFFIGLLAAVLLYREAAAHPSLYPPPRRADGSVLCEDAQTEAQLESIPYHSYHIHTMFWQNNEEHTKGAERLKERLVTHFNITNHCTSLFHQNTTCYFETDYSPAGPFLVGQWAIYVHLEDFAPLAQWISQHRGIYDVLIHPNSGCAVRDHEDWPFWIGTPWQIDLKVFRHYKMPWGPIDPASPEYPKHGPSTPPYTQRTHRLMRG